MVGKASEGTSDFDAQGLILMNSLVSDNIRPLKFCSTKVEAVEMLGKMAEFLTSEILLDRVVPYLVGRWAILPYT